jgi:hypothetical protein
MRFYNTAGPVRKEDHYCIDPLTRIDLDAVLLLISQKKYFAIHAPRQTGKTSVFLALADHLNSLGIYRALYFNIESVLIAKGNLVEKYEIHSLGARLARATTSTIPTRRVS